MPAPFRPVAPGEICAIVVTYNPDASSLECIRGILKAAAHTVIIDNRSVESCRQPLRELASPRVTWVENPDNVGVAAALNQGMRTAAGLGHRWCLLFDQDTKILPTTLADLLEALNECRAELGPKFGLLGSNFFHGLADGTADEASVPFCPGRRWLAKETVITSGTIIGLDSFEAIGPFREEFFIDHVDHEYCLRAQHKGFVVARTVWPVMVHRLGLLGNRRSWVAFGAKKLVSMYSPLRHYYQIRNLAVLVREHEKEFPATIDLLRKCTRREMRRSLKYEGRFLRNLIAVVLAKRHGRRGITGKYQGRIAL
jgi:rhamnosyltransferase